MPEDGKAKFTAGWSVFVPVLVALVTSVGGYMKSRVEIEAANAKAQSAQEQVVRVEQRGVEQRGRLRARVEMLEGEVATLKKIVRGAGTKPKSTKLKAGEFYGPPEPARQGTLLRTLKRLWPW